MPVIARFYGIVIKMYFRESEHNSPHFHCIYGEYVGVIRIDTFEMIEGDLPNKALNLVKEWGEKYRTELIKMWDTQQFLELPSLI